MNAQQQICKIFALLRKTGLHFNMPFSARNYIDILSKIDSHFLYCENGMSKAAIEFVELPNYIIKIPFNGAHKSTQEFTPFSAALYSISECDGEWDYCKVEKLLYGYAQQAGLEKFFLPTELLGYVNDYPVYIQKKVCPWDAFFHKAAIQYIANLPDAILQLGASLSQNYADFFDFKADWTATLIHESNYKEVKNLCSFLQTYAITDLHEGNYGVIINERTPVLFDYCGFFDNV